MTGSPTANSPFLRLPTEIRLQIYALLLLPQKAQDLLPSFDKIKASTSDYCDYDKLLPNGLPATADLRNPTLLIRTIDPTRYILRYRDPRPVHERATYSVRSDRFRARLMPTTYQVLNNPGIQSNLSVMRLNKQIHAEAAELLYSHYTFDFDTHIEAMVPFFQDLTPFARSFIRSIKVVKRALAYEKEFDRAEWTNAMQFVASNLNLRSLSLGVVAGRPGVGWSDVETYSASDFGLLKRMPYMEWLRSLLIIKGVTNVAVNAIVEHCPPATSSEAMADYIRFSASVENGFAQFLRQELVKP